MRRACGGACGRRARNFAAGEYVGPYVGTLTTDDETIARYCAENILSASLKCDYLFHVNDTYSIDAQNSTHFSRYFNHAEHGNLVSSTDEDELRVDFYAARDIAADEELSACGADPSAIFDRYLNLCPVQGSRTIRSEEAVLVGMAALRPHVERAQAVR